MTVTEARPAPAEAPEPKAAVAVSTVGSLGSADHKHLGLVYIVASTVFLVLGVVVGELLQLHLVAPGTRLAGDRYDELFSLHALTTTVLFLAPLWLGLGTYLLPLQIGASRLAFPRLHALATWTYVVGGVVVLASYLTGTPTRTGITVSQPMVHLAGLTGADRTATSLWVTGLVLVGLASVLAAADLIVTMLAMRAPGLTLRRVPLLSWGTFAASSVVLLATPVFLAGLVLLYLDQRFGGGFFSPGNPAGVAVWRHAIWLFGRPEAYALLLPGLGAGGDIVVTHGRGPLPSRQVARGAITAFALLSFGAWAMSKSAAAHAVVLPTATWLTGLAAVPVGVTVLLWLGVLRAGRPRLHVSLLFVVGAVLLLAMGAGAAVVAAAVHLRAGTAWSTGHLHLVLVGAPMLLAFAALYHWAPKMLGRHLPPILGGLQLLLLLGGFAALGGAQYGLGYRHMPWHRDAPPVPGVRGLHTLAAAGGGLVLLGVLVFALVFLVAMTGRGEEAGADPYDGSTLEWATTSPPPPHNFDSLPEIRSASPVSDLRAAAARLEGGG